MVVGITEVAAGGVMIMVPIVTVVVCVAGSFAMDNINKELTAVPHT